MMDRKSLFGAAIVFLVGMLVLSCSLIAGPQNGPGAGSAPGVIYGYDNATPVAIVPVSSGLSIQLSDVTYKQVKSMWVLGGYKVAITSGSTTTNIEFTDLTYGNGPVTLTGYTAVENGVSHAAPARNSFSTNGISNGVGVYPNGDDAGYFLALPCSVSSSNEATGMDQYQNIWMPHISEASYTCSSGGVYNLVFSDFTYMEQPVVELSGFFMAVIFAG